MERAIARLQTGVSPAPGSKPSRVGLLGPYSSRNLGDTAIQMAVMENLRARKPALEFVGLCPDPLDTVRSLRIPAFALNGRGPILTLADLDRAAQTAGKGARWHAFRRIARLLRSLDLLIVSGGGQLDDYWGGTWNHPFELFRWCVLARVYRVRVAFIGIGLDRLSTPLSRFLALSALRSAHYRAFRDAGTLAALRSFGLRAPSHICPDLAFSLDADQPAADRSSSPERFIAVNPISESTWTHAGDPRHEAYLRNLAAACSWTAERGLRVRIVCSQSRMDRPIAVRLAQMIEPRLAASVELREAPRVPDFLAQVRGAQAVVASRLHGAILSLLEGAPVVAISPMPKVTRLMQDAGLGDYCVELQSFAATDLIARMESALKLHSELRRQVRERTQAFRDSLAHTFDDVAALADRSAVNRRGETPAQQN